MSFVDVLKSAITSNKEAKLVNAEGGVVEDIGAAEFVQIGDSEKFKLGEESQFKGSKMYDVKSVYFCWMNRDAAVTEYIELCENNKVDVISFVEKTDLISYLKGRQIHPTMSSNQTPMRKMARKEVPGTMRKWTIRKASV